MICLDIREIHTWFGDIKFSRMGPEVVLLKMTVCVFGTKLYITRNTKQRKLRIWNGTNVSSPRTNHPTKETPAPCYERKESDKLKTFFESRLSNPVANNI